MNRELVENWIAYHQNGRKVSDDRFLVCEQVEEIVGRDAESGWTLILDLTEAAPDDFILAAIAAGPLENLLNDSPDVLVDRVEIEARRNPKFRRCLTGVWGIPDSVRKRIAKYLTTVENPL